MSIILTGVLLTGCKSKSTENQSMKQNKIISANTVEKLISSLTDSLGQPSKFRIERGVKQVADLWRETDGNEKEFTKFCTENFVADTLKLDILFSRIERNLEIISGNYNQIDLKLKEPIQLTGWSETPVDMLFGGYDVTAHLDEDLYANKVAFITALNFPFYTLEEKTQLGEKWTRKQWAYARMGDRFISRVPPDLLQHLSQTLTDAESYISNYNIYMEQLVNDKGEKLFPADMRLVSHWGLRDELKSDYADKINGITKQEMIYNVMKRIIDQSIPLEVINKNDYTWNPSTNKIYKNGKEIAANPENNKRYEVLLNNFKASRQIDAYSPHYPDAISRNFDKSMEIPLKDVETMFKSFLSSSQVKEVAKFIQTRIGRELRPYDIWYNGFKSNGNISEDDLSKITTKKYPDPKAVEKDLPNFLMKLGWKSDKAQKIASLVQVDPSLGSGHAWGAMMKDDKAHLRTRIGAKGMDYKGYNIALHEFGHNTEQTITLNDVDYWMLYGVPNNAFTEALAFMFQKRDLEMLGIKNANQDTDAYLALDNFWTSYEIMGVALVDIAVWQWMYANPDATSAQLKDAVITEAKKIWNEYYAGILGGKDEPILGVYSHMISIPLYLSYYPMGHIIDFQIEQQMKGKNFADEIQKMYTQGRIIPQIWMKKSVGAPISIDPTLKAVDEALKVVK
ncbi:MAG: hypothetical protein H6Q18_396 [Bacteroidetes bacterium]|nr:hypothetical protein [Bacteroidota bacterium]